MTATAGAVYTASQYNAQTRDNFLQTGPALVSGAGQIMVSTAANALAARTPTQAYVATVETTTSTSFADLATVGPAVTVTTGTQAIVCVQGGLANSGNFSCLMGYAITGATSFSPLDDSYAILCNAGSGGSTIHCSGVFLHTGLTAGSNTFTAKYRVSSASNTGTFNLRRLFVIPL
jgi:hypothetical protein